ncbi:uncharacterized protein LOC143132889, partial [Alosa pseudoharengus]|uniref:uncharacterized protein LOC143132889 n=1 Tax=Alosa pseudoharengus TaxID=34774 RepID=UPI003F89F66B
FVFRLYRKNNNSELIILQFKNNTTYYNQLDTQRWKFSPDNGTLIINPVNWTDSGMYKVQVYHTDGTLMATNYVQLIIKETTPMTPTVSNITYPPQHNDTMSKEQAMMLISGSLTVFFLCVAGSGGVCYICKRRKSTHWTGKTTQSEESTHSKSQPEQMQWWEEMVEYRCVDTQAYHTPVEQEECQCCETCIYIREQSILTIFCHVCWAGMESICDATCNVSSCYGTHGQPLFLLFVSTRQFVFRLYRKNNNSELIILQFKNNTTYYNQLDTQRWKFSPDNGTLIINPVNWTDSGMYKVQVYHTDGTLMATNYVQLIIKETTPMTPTVSNITYPPQHNDTMSKEQGETFVTLLWYIGMLLPSVTICLYIYIYI